jgi:hypothetical protein
VTGIPDEAVSWFSAGAHDAGAGVYMSGGEWRVEATEAQIRAGLAAALPHLADACDALRAAERSRVSTATPGPFTAADGNLSGLQGHSEPTHNPTDITREDTNA